MFPIYVLGISYRNSSSLQLLGIHIHRGPLYFESERFFGGWNFELMFVFVCVRLAHRRWFWRS